MDQEYCKKWALKIQIFILENDIHRIKYYLDNMPNNVRRKIICINVYGKSALFEACALQRYTIIRYFVEECKVDVNIRSEEGTLPVFTACELGDVPLLEYLHSFGGYIYLLDEKCRTLIMKFVNNASICDVLISRKVDIQTRDSDGKTALYYALSTSSTRTLELLLQNGACVNQPNANGIYPIEEACLNNDSDSLRILLHYGASVNIKEKEGKTLLMQFVKFFDICKILLQNSISVNKTDDNGMSAIHYAINNGADLKLLELLLSFGADINAKNIEGLTPAALAIQRGGIHCLKYLLQKGADVNAFDINDSCLLHHAVETGDLDIVKLLINNCAPPNVCDKKDIEPIILAACRDNSQIVEYFIQHLDIANVSKVHALELLASNELTILNHYKAVGYLKSAMEWRLSNEYNFKSKSFLNELFSNVIEPKTVEEVMDIDDDNTSMLMLASIIRGRILGSYNFSVLEVLENLTVEWMEEEIDPSLITRILLHMNKIAVIKYGENDIRSARYMENTVSHLCRLDQSDRTLNVTIDVLTDFIQQISRVVICHTPGNQKITKLQFQQCMLLIYLCLMDDTSEANKNTIEIKFKEIISKCPNDDISKTFIHCILDDIIENDLTFHKETFLKFLILLISNKINVSSVDYCNKTIPLHKFCSCQIELEDNTDAENRTNPEVLNRIVRLLLENGNHICIKDRYSCTTFDHLQNISYPVHEVRDKSLQCLAATVIANNNIIYNELPPHLKTFIEQH